MGSHCHSLIRRFARPRIKYGAGSSPEGRRKARALLPAGALAPDLAGALELRLVLGFVAGPRVAGGHFGFSDALLPRLAQRAIGDARALVAHHLAGFARAGLGIAVQAHRAQGDAARLRFLAFG